MKPARSVYRSPGIHSCAWPGAARVAISADTKGLSVDTDRQVRSDVSNALLEARNIHFRAQNRYVLKGVNLAIGRGEIVSLLGANGAGKTTLLRLMLGLAKPLGGDLLIGGAPLASLSRSQVASRLAYVPQAHVAAFPYTVREVVTMGRLPKRSLLSYPSEHDGEIVRDVLDQLKILHLADRVYSEISGGERQLTLVARALAQESPILILDEPMANLDFGYQGVLAQYLRNLSDSGQTVLMTGHDPQFACHASSRVALLIDGHIEMDGPPQQVLTDNTMRRLYGVDVESVAVSGDRVAFFPRVQRRSSADYSSETGAPCRPAPSD
jgi:iron complex transport system ATP-binding protein